MLNLLRVLLGAFLLGFGRSLYWLFVGGAGFLAVNTLASRLLEGSPRILLLAIAVAAGLLGALLAILLQKFAVGLAGFLAGGYFFVILLDLLKLDYGPVVWILFVVGGILGAILVASLFEVSLIFLSSLSGALLIAQSLRLTPVQNALLVSGCLLAGVIVQSVLLVGERGEA